MVGICMWSSILHLPVIVVSELNMWRHLMNQVLLKHDLQHHLRRHQLQLNLLPQVFIHLFLWNCRFSKPPSTKAQNGSNVPFQASVASFAKLNMASIVKRARINLSWTLKDVTASLGRVVLVALVSIFEGYPLASGLTCFPSMNRLRLNCGCLISYIKLKLTDLSIQVFPTNL